MRGRILIVDDDEHIIRALAEVLESEEVETICVTDGREAIDVFRDELPDFVFLDMLLPGCSGEQVCEEIRSTLHGLVTPVVFMTGIYRNSPKLQVIQEHGLVDYLIKPFGVDELLTIISQLRKNTEEEEGGEEATVAAGDLDALELSAGDGGVFDVDAAALCSILANIATHRSSGTLYGVRGAQRRALTFFEGRLVAVRSNAAAHRMDKLLVTMRKMTPKQLSRPDIAHKLGESDAKTLKVLESSGQLSGSSVKRASLFQAVSVFLSLFHWSDGLARFVEGEKAKATVWDRVEARSLILLGLRRTPSLLARLIESLPSDETLLKSTPAAETCAEEDLTRAEHAVLAAAAEGRSLGELRRLGRQAQTDIDPIMARLLAGRLLEPDGREQRQEGGDGWPDLAVSSPPLEGSGSAMSVARVLGDIIRARRSGALHLDAAHTRRLSFEAGELVAAWSSRPDEELTSIVVNESRLTQKAFEQPLLYLGPESGSRVPSILVRRGWLGLEHVDALRELQVRRTLAGALAGSEMGFRFVAEEIPGEGGLSLGTTALALLRQVMLKMDVAIVKGELGGPGTSLVPTVEVEASALAGLTEEEAGLLDRMRQEEKGLDAGRLLPGDRASLALLLVLGLCQAVERDSWRGELPKQPAETTLGGSEVIEVELESDEVYDDAALSMGVEGFAMAPPPRRISHAGPAGDSADLIALMEGLRGQIQSLDRGPLGELLQRACLAVQEMRHETRLRLTQMTQEMALVRKRLELLEAAAAKAPATTRKKTTTRKTTKKKTTKKKATTRKTSAARKPKASESVPEEQPKASESVPEEQPKASESVPEEQPSLDPVGV